MDEILKQLLGLLLTSIPTIVLFLLVFTAYRVILHGPLERVLGERRKRTEGALEKARADIAAAEAKTRQYEESIREAKIALFKAQENRRQLALQARTAAVAQARALANVQVQQARKVIDREVENSKLALHGEGERLAGEIIQALLGRVTAAQYPVGGGE